MIEENKQSLKKEKKTFTAFRISAKRIFLTYSKVNEKINTQTVLEQLQKKQDVSKYLIAEERHKEQGKHFHVLLESHNKFNIKDVNTLDITDGDNIYHGNYQQARNYKSVAKYVGKDKNFITNYPNFVNGEFISVEEDMLRIAPILTTEEAEKYYVNNYTAHALKGMNIRNSKQYLAAIAQTLDEKQKNTDKVNNCLKIKDFNIPDRLKTWIEQKGQPTLVMVGEPGIGKTLLAKALAEEMKLEMLTCNHLEGLKKLTEKHKAILFDDFSFKGIDEQQLLAIIATDEEKQIRVLHGYVNKPKGIVQIIALNVETMQKTLKDKILPKQFLRRILLIKVKKPLIVNLNINIEVNNHTNIYNNPDNIKENQRQLNEL